MLYTQQTRAHRGQSPGLRKLFLTSPHVDTAMMVAAVAMSTKAAAIRMKFFLPVISPKTNMPHSEDTRPGPMLHAPFRERES